MPAQTATQTGSDSGAVDGYAPAGRRPPLLAYAGTMAVFGGLFSAAIGVARRSGRDLPKRIDGRDLAAIGVASHKLSRLIAKDKVTTPLRAPFTEYQKDGGPAEVEERSRGRGARKAVGELLTCPYCLGLWALAAEQKGLG